MDPHDRFLVNYFSDARSYSSLYEEGSLTGYLLSTRIRKVSDLLDDLSERKVLDCGCGPGMVVNLLTERNCEYWGVDLSLEMVNECKRMFYHTGFVHLLVARVEKLPFPDSSFDIVLCLGVIEYAKVPLNLILEMSRVVKDDGVVIVSMTNAESPYVFWAKNIYHGRISNLLRKILKHQPSFESEPKVFKVHEFHNLLETGGLIVNDVTYFCYGFWLMPLDKYFPRFAIFTARKLEFLAQGRLRSLGAGCIFKATKAHDNPAG